MDTFRQVDLTPEQTEAALALGEGPVLFAYMDQRALRMETTDGEDPFVWRDGGWRRMIERPA